jgi:TPR repeat protein
LYLPKALKPKPETLIQTKQVGICYREGWGVQVDEAKAMEWFEMGAKLGDVECKYHVAAELLEKAVICTD